MSGEPQTPAAFSPRKNPGRCLIGGWIDPRAGLNVLENRKIACFCLDLNPGPSRPVPSHSDDAISVFHVGGSGNEF